MLFEFVACCVHFSHISVMHHFEHACLSFVLLLLQVPIPPVMSSPITVSVPENLVGAMSPSVANFTVDYQGAVLTYAIAYGNDAGYFAIDSQTGVLSVLRTGPGLGGGLNYELQSSERKAGPIEILPINRIATPIFPQISYS